MLVHLLSMPGLKLRYKLIVIVSAAAMTWAWWNCPSTYFFLIYSSEPQILVRWAYDSGVYNTSTLWFGPAIWWRWWRIHGNSCLPFDNFFIWALNSSFMIFFLWPIPKLLLFLFIMMCPYWVKMLKILFPFTGKVVWLFFLNIIFMYLSFKFNCDAHLLYVYHVGKYINCSLLLNTRNVWSPLSVKLLWCIYLSSSGLSWNACTARSSYALGR